MSVSRLIIESVCVWGINKSSPILLVIKWTIAEAIYAVEYSKAAVIKSPVDKIKYFIIFQLTYYHRSIYIKLYYKYSEFLLR